MKRVAAVDIGTNSVRLLVAEVDGTSPRDAKVVPARPAHAHHAPRPGRRQDRARSRPRRSNAPSRCCASTAPRSTSTASPRCAPPPPSAARDASNRDDFFTAAHDALGVTPELLSGDEEAALSFLGATADLDAPAPYLVVDIGGGSTEFVLGTDAPVGLVSLDMGCVRITEQFLESDPPAPEELSNAVAAVRDLVAEVPRVIPGAHRGGDARRPRGHRHHRRRGRARHPRVRPREDPPLRADARRRRRRVPHARHRERRAARAQPGARTGPRRRDRRRHRGARRHLPRRSASTRCWSARPTSSTVWCAARSSRAERRNGETPRSQGIARPTSEIPQLDPRLCRECRAWI